MSWPWVTRRTHDDLMRLTERLQDDLRVAHQCLAESQRHCAQLMHVLTPPKPSESPHVKSTMLVPLPTPERDEIEEAIELAAGTDSALARHLGRWSKKAKLDGAKERDIINSILHWKTADVWDGDTNDTPGAY